MTDYDENNITYFEELPLGQPFYWRGKNFFKTSRIAAFSLEDKREKFFKYSKTRVVKARMRLIRDNSERNE